ncbi:unnamed protein product [Withania somnifera]
MTEAVAAATAAAAVSSISPENVHGGDVRDDGGLPPDPLLQSGTYIDVETATPNKDVADEGKVSDLATAPEESKIEMQKAVQETENVKTARRASRSTEGNVERPSWLPDDWGFDTKVRTNGATAGLVDRYYYEPVSGAKFRSKAEVLYFLETGGKRKKANTGTGSDATQKAEEECLEKRKKKSTDFYFDSANPPHSVCWIQTDSSADTWVASVNGHMVPDSQKQQWDAVYSTVAKLRRRNT